MLLEIQGSKYFTKCSFNFINRAALGILTHGDELSHFAGRAKFEPLKVMKFQFLILLCISATDIVNVVLLLYVLGKQLWSRRDGQLT